MKRLLSVVLAVACLFVVLGGVAYAGKGKGNPIFIGKGITVPLGADAPYIDSLNVKAYINWSYNAFTGTNARHVKMIWGPNTKTYVLAHPEVMAGADIVLLYNEPESQYQANVSPQQAAADTIELQAAFPDVQYWGTPATFCNEENFWFDCSDYDWLEHYFQYCAGQCQIDFIAAHHYSYGTDFGGNNNCDVTPGSKFYNHMVHFLSFGYPVWVTEYGCISYNPSYQLGKTSEMHNFMENVIGIAGYFPWTLYVSGFGDFDTMNYIDVNNNLTALGQNYAPRTSKY